MASAYENVLKVRWSNQDEIHVYEAAETGLIEGVIRSARVGSELHAESSSGNITKVKQLVDDGEDINAKNKDGWTSLHCAAFNGHVSVTDLLIELKADVHDKDKNEKTALQWASFKGHTSVVESLLQAGADTDTQDSSQCTPLHLASSSGHESVVQSLIGAGASVNKTDENGDTPLHCAARKGHLSVIHLLHQVDSVLYMGNSLGQSPLHLASLNGHTHVVDYLLQLVAVNINEQDNDGCTPLYCAAKKGHISVVQSLLSCGADVTVKNARGKTAYAAICTGEGAKHVHESTIFELFKNHPQKVQALLADAHTRKVVQLARLAERRARRQSMSLPPRSQSASGSSIRVVDKVRSSAEKARPSDNSKAKKQIGEDNVKRQPETCPPQGQAKLAEVRLKRLAEKYTVVV